MRDPRKHPNSAYLYHNGDFISRDIKRAPTWPQTPLHLGLALTDESASDKYFLRLLSKCGSGEDSLKKLRSLLLTATRKLPKQDPPPESVSPDSALVRLLKAADALRKKAGDSHVAVDHIISAAIAEAQLTKIFAEGREGSPCLRAATSKLVPVSSAKANNMT